MELYTTAANYPGQDVLLHVNSMAQEPNIAKIPST